MTTPAVLYISRDDHARLRLLLASAASVRASQTLEQLREELDRAVILDPTAVPANVVTLDSRVEYEDVDTGEVEAYTITLPERADLEEKRISILAPIGVALLGYRVGDTVRWSTPGGIRRLRILGVTPAAVPLAVAGAL